MDRPTSARFTKDSRHARVNWLASAKIPSSKTSTPPSRKPRPSPPHRGPESAQKWSAHAARSSGKLAPMKSQETSRKESRGRSSAVAGFPSSPHGVQVPTPPLDLPPSDDVIKPENVSPVKPQDFRNGVPAGLVSLASWRRQVGISDTTAWRWKEAGWIHPVNISGRPYLRADDIAVFSRRAAAGEFSKPVRGAAATSAKARAEKGRAT